GDFLQEILPNHEIGKSVLPYSLNTEFCWSDPKPILSILNKLVGCPGVVGGSKKPLKAELFMPGHAAIVVMSVVLSSRHWVCLSERRKRTDGKGIHQLYHCHLELPGGSVTPTRSSLARTVTFSFVTRSPPSADTATDRWRWLRVAASKNMTGVSPVCCDSQLPPYTEDQSFGVTTHMFRITVPYIDCHQKVSPRFKFVLKQFLGPSWGFATCKVKKEKGFEFISAGHETAFCTAASVFMCSQLTCEQGFIFCKLNEKLHENVTAFFCFISAVLQEFILSEDYNKMTPVKNYQAHQSRVTMVLFVLELEWVLSTGQDKQFAWHCSESGQRLGCYHTSAVASGLQYPLLDKSLSLRCINI
ncbi:hypothetical protein STEG23_032860, partial [Scotinomys teguina]